MNNLNCYLSDDGIFTNINNNTKSILDITMKQVVHSKDSPLHIAFSKIDKNYVILSADYDCFDLVLSFDENELRIHQLNFMNRIIKYTFSCYLTGFLRLLLYVETFL